jgi:hypothetical protein
MDEFEVFTGKSSRVSGGPVVTIQRGGIFALNADAYEALGRAEAVELLYSRENQIIGFRPVSSEVSHAYRLRKARATESYLVSGRAFLANYQLDDPERYAGRYNAEARAGNMLTVSVKTKPVSMRRGGKEKAA